MVLSALWKHDVSQVGIHPEAVGEEGTGVGLVYLDAVLRGDKCPKCGLPREGIVVGEESNQEAGICGCKEEEELAFV